MTVDAGRWGVRRTARMGRSNLFASLALPVLLLPSVTLTLLATAAQAKTLSAMAPQPSHADNKPTPPVADDGLAGGGLYLEADKLTQNQTTHHVIATGGVEIRYKGRVLRADRVDYNSDSGDMAASGNVEIINSDGTAQFAESITLDKTMSEGFAQSFSTRMEGHVQIAATSVTRRDANVTDFRGVIYTPCLV